MTINLDIRSDDQGRFYLHFPFLCISDIHLGTKQSRGKLLCRMFQNIVVDRLILAGDIIDIEALEKQKKWKFRKWQRQFIAHILRHADSGSQVDYLEGNHEGEKISQKLTEKNIYNINFKEKTTHLDPQGRNFLILHGHQYDRQITELSAQEPYYRFGEVFHKVMNQAGGTIKNTVLFEDSASVVASLKRARFVEQRIKKYFRVNIELEKSIDASIYDGAIYGHTHNASFVPTSKQKLLINDGCCVENVQALVHDREGNWAIVEWHKKHLKIFAENGSRKKVTWRELGLHSFRDTPLQTKDKYIENSDRLLKLIYRFTKPYKNEF